MSKIIILLSTILLNTAALAQSVAWDVDGSRLGGNGCQKDVDTFISTNGDDISVVFTSLGINLPGGSGGPLAARRNCIIELLAEIPKGSYIGELTQAVTYGVVKSEKSDGVLDLRSKFFGQDVSPHGANIPRRAVNNPLLVNARRDQFSRNSPWQKNWCKSNREPKGRFLSKITVSGKRDSKDEDLIMFVDGLDLKFEIITKLTSC